MNYRSYVLRTLWIGAALFVLFLVSLFLWLALGGLGDAAGSQAAKGITLALAICFTFDFVGLVVLLALAYLEATPQPASGKSPGENLPNEQ